MKKMAITFFIVLIIIVGGAATMFVFKLCPPQGPWPTPPWCKGKAYIPYKYKILDYIQQDFKSTDKQLDFIIGTMDIWGNPHLWIDLGENTKDHVDTTMKKLGEFGSEGLYLTDFVRISKDLSVEQGGIGASSMTQSEMNKIVSEARKNQQNKIILIVNLYDPEAGIRRYRSQGMEGTVSERLWNNQSVDNWKKLFDNWKDYISEEAQKASNAGVDYLIVTPGDFVFSSFQNKTYLNKKYSEFIDKARQNFKGKVGIFTYYYDIPNLDDNVLNKADFIVVSWDPNGDPVIREIFKGVKEDVDEIEKSFTKWLSLPNWDKLKGKEVYLSITMPSYDGALQKGWIEPGAKYGDEYKVDYKEQALAYEGLFRTLYNNDFSISGVISYGYWWTDRIYPEVEILRNDLSHSIRNKDAEHVFYKWSNIFK